MPFQPLRFIHAAYINLDRPLVDTGVLSDNVRRVVQQATITAFERLVDACVDQRVDFLVLTENTFRERDRSLKARLAVLAGLRKLADHDIDVFVLPGSLDPASSWRSIAGLPDNVTVFRSDSTEPVAYMRDGHVIATLSIATERSQRNRAASQTQPGRSRAFSIGLLSATNAGLSEGDLAMASIYAAFSKDEHDNTTESAVRSATRQLVHNYGLSGFDYLAIGSRRQVMCELDMNSLAHSPGATQALFSMEGGQHGCSLVDVSAQGDISCQPVPVATVRREAIPILVNADSTRSELIEAMQRAADEMQLADNEEACLIDWAVIGSGALFRAAMYEPFQEQVLSMNEVGVLPGGVSLAQRMHCVSFRKASAAPQGASDKLTIDEHVSTASRLDPTLDSDLQLEFVSLLNDQAAMCRELMNECLKQERSAGDQMAQLQAIAVEVDENDVMGFAKQAGERWFVGDEEGAV